MWGRAFIFAIVLAIQSIAAAQQDSDPRVAEARQHFTLAEGHYAQTDYALALDEYRTSYEIMSSIGHPRAGIILFNVARCYRELNRDCEAQQAYQQFLVEAPADFEERPTAEQELRELRARLELSGGCSGGIHPAGPIIIGVGAASLIAGAILGGLALSLNDESMEGCVAGECPPENEPIHADAQLYANLADGFLFGGLGVAAVGVVLTFVLPADSPVSAGVSSEGAMLFTQGRF